jgi:hypothetical protein
MGLLVDGVPFDLSRYPWNMDVLDTDHPEVVIRKGAQLGLTITMILRTLDMSHYVYPRGVLYLMPTTDDVSDFSKTRFDRLMKENPETLGAFVGSTDSVNVRKIGNTFVYFRGARSRSKLKSIPVDALFTDEEDEMDPAMVGLAEHRLDGSEFKHHFRLSTPTIPDFGVDYFWNRSDQSCWFIKCRACGAETCLELDWPDSVKRRPDSIAFRACKNCAKELDVADGRWVALDPTKSERKGYWVSQLCSPTVSLTDRLDEWEGGELSGESLKEFYNSVLGMPYADIEDVLDERVLRSHCRDEPRQRSDPGPCFLGADVGKQLHHYFVAKKVAEKKFDVLSYGVTDWNGLHDVSRAFNVRVGCLDMMAETHAVRQFQETHPWCWGCIYSEAQRKAYDWSSKDLKVTVNRTELLDHSHRLIIQGNVSFPRPDLHWQIWVKQMCNLARTIVKEEHTGTPKVRWVLRGRKNDHYRHAFAYLILAAETAPLAERERRIVTPREARNEQLTWMAD